MTSNCGISRSAEVDQAPELITIKKVINFNYTWIIHNIKSDLEMFHSPVFSNQTNKEIKWRLQLDKYKNVISNGARECTTACSVKLGAVSNDANKIQTNCKFKILSSIPDKTIYCRKPFQFTSGIYTFCFETEEEIDILDPANGYLQMDSITVMCEINVKQISKPLAIPKCTLYNNLNLIYENRKFCDVTLCASGKEYQAHKVILAAQSPVFSAMFEHNMEENQNNRVDVTDIEGEVLEELLRFIYTGKVVNLENLAKDLLPAADKYGFERLKVLCGKALCQNISIENATEILVLADMYRLHQFKAVAIGFIGAHIADVTKTPGWESMIKSYPNLVTAVICDVSQQLYDIISENER